MARRRGDSRRRSRSTWTSRALRPGDPPGQPDRAERVARHDRTEPLEQRPGEAGLDRRQRDPAVAEAQHAVVVEGGHQPGVAVGAAAERLDPDPEVEVVGGEPDPVLELVGGDRRSTPLDEEQAGLAGTAELLTPVLLGRPLHECHLHGHERYGAQRFAFVSVG